MNTATAYPSNLSVLGGKDVAPVTTQPSRELSIDELVWVGGGSGVTGTK
jgi:hypothetical protein